jgi:hypothetical protein
MPSNSRSEPDNRNAAVFADVREGWSHSSVLRFYSQRISEGFQGQEQELADRYVSPEDSLLLVGGGGVRDAARLVTQGCLIVFVSWLRPSRASVLPDSFQWLRVWKQWLSGNFSAREPGDALLRSLIPEAKLRRPCFYHYFQGPHEIEQELRESGLTLLDRIGGIWVARRRKQDTDFHG